MLELHSNFTAEGSQTAGGVLGTNHQQHETVEITQGWNKWFETGFYIFTSIQGSDGWQWVGDHIRPRVAIPEDWKWPVGLSLSTEFGYQRALRDQEHQIYPAIDVDFGPQWEFNFGIGVGMTQSTDHLIVKMILGRRFGKVKASSD